MNDENARANRFYEKSGFAIVGTKTFQLGANLESDFVRERPAHLTQPEWDHGKSPFRERLRAFFVI